MLLKASTVIKNSIFLLFYINLFHFKFPVLLTYVPTVCQISQRITFTFYVRCRETANIIVSPDNEAS